ncbi:uncharacterized protein LOC144054147 isoform X2 [Vanacampus margaritifer]
MSSVSAGTWIFQQKLDVYLRNLSTLRWTELGPWAEGGPGKPVRKCLSRCQGAGRGLAAMADKEQMATLTGQKTHSVSTPSIHPLHIGGSRTTVFVTAKLP